jgi:hypothetical protein
VSRRSRRAAASTSSASDRFDGVDRELRSDAKLGVDRDHGRAAGVDGVDDLGAVDVLQVDRRDAEAGVPELALDDDQQREIQAASPENDDDQP